MAIRVEVAISCPVSPAILTLPSQAGGPFLSAPSSAQLESVMKAPVMLSEQDGKETVEVTLLMDNCPLPLWGSDIPRDTRLSELSPSFHLHLHEPRKGTLGTETCQRWLFSPPARPRCLSFLLLSLTFFHYLPLFFKHTFLQVAQR